jgi:hypothetical protein
MTSEGLRHRAEPILSAVAFAHWVVRPARPERSHWSLRRSTAHHCFGDGMIARIVDVRRLLRGDSDRPQPSQSTLACATTPSARTPLIGRPGARRSSIVTATLTGARTVRKPRPDRS